MTQTVTTTRTPQPIQRGGWLDALRFIVAFLIILHHYELAAPVPLNQFHPVFERGYLLTNFFLMDSGYVLARVYGAGVLAGAMSPGEFFRKRFLRIVPAHLIMVSALVAFVLASTAIGFAPRHPEWFDWRELPAQILLLQAYGVPGGQGWNAPSWSLSALLGCYLAFPLLILFTSAGSPWRVLAASVGVYALAHLATTSLIGHPVYQMPMGWGFVRALPLFLLGMALARVSDGVYVPPRLAAAVGIGAALTLAALQFDGRHSLASLALIAVIIVAAGAIPVRRRSWLVEKAAVVSFAMFVSNEVVRIVWFGVVNAADARLGFSEPVQWALWGLGVIAAVAFAVAFHAMVDVPLQRALNRKRDKTRPRASGQAISPGVA